MNSSIALRNVLEGLLKIRKMVLVMEESERNPSEEEIVGGSRRDLLEKYEWILKRFFEEELEEISRAMEGGGSLEIYFFAGENRWGDIETSMSGKSYPITRSRIGYFLHKIVRHNGEGSREELPFKQPP